ncbi:histidine kinase [Streptomyces sp. NPDC001941]|uniref:histidine kinase n=1 Tax=Streptomyces sp. NPDC001941 TaxID=3154659 RepID=UPI003326EF3D
MTDHHVLLISFADPARCREAFREAAGLPGLSHAAVLERSAEGLLDVPETYVGDSTGHAVGAGVAGGLVGLLAGPIGAFLGMANASALAEAVESAREEEAGAALIFVSSRIEDGTSMLVVDVHEESPREADALAARYGGTLERLPAKEFGAQVRAAQKAASRKD